MKEEYFEVESVKAFSQSRLWHLNREFYQQKGIDAWSENVVPHHMTSNSMVGKTYAELILAFLKELSAKDSIKEVVYLLELGAGHGRLAFHILKHLEKLISLTDEVLPPFCYILSDIGEKNLTFFQDHPQLRTYYEQGVLDLAYFDALESREVQLRVSGKNIDQDTLNQPLIVLANYFFDSIPTELFHIQHDEMSSCSVSLHSQKDPQSFSIEEVIKNLELKYYREKAGLTFFEDDLMDELLSDYRSLLKDTYLFFPFWGMQCLNRLVELSKEGILLLSMDKGYHEIHDLEKKPEPDIVIHGSLSIWVNYHALGSYCSKKGGMALFPSSSTFHLDVACLLFLKEADNYPKLRAVFQRVVEDFGPDDFNSMKQMAYSNLSRLNVMDLLALIRLSAYDSTFFIKLLPRLKQVAKSITFNERKRIGESLHAVWTMYFSIQETYDLAYEIGGLFYDLGFYREALQYFQYAMDLNGPKPDTYYNRVLCHYQLREDELCLKVFQEAKKAYPEDRLIKELDQLDMNAV